MASSTGGAGSSNPSPPPKILLAKPGLVTGGPVAGKFPRSGGGGDDETTTIRSRLPSVGSLNLLSDSWDFHIDRFLPFLTDNTEFTVVGVIGPPGVGKSTIMNEIYGFDPSSPGMLPPFTLHSEDTRAMARHCSVGLEPRISAERIILLDTQPLLSPSILSEIMRPDGLSTVSVLSGESLSAELALEVMGIQLGVLLASICNVLLVVSEGVHDDSMWHLMLTVDLLKHGIPDPSSLTPHSQSSSSGLEKSGEYIAAPVFVHTKMLDQDLTPQNLLLLRKALVKYFHSSSFMREYHGKDNVYSAVVPGTTENQGDASTLCLHAIPYKSKDDCPRTQYASYSSALWKLRDQVLSMSGPSFSRPVSEREWLKNSAKIWELVKNSPILIEYCKTLQNSALFTR